MHFLSVEKDTYFEGSLEMNGPLRSHWTVDIRQIDGGQTRPSNNGNVARAPYHAPFVGSGKAPCRPSVSLSRMRAAIALVSRGLPNLTD